MKLKLDRRWSGSNYRCANQKKKKKRSYRRKFYLYKYLTDFHLLNKNRTDALSVSQNVVSLYFSQCKKKKNVLSHPTTLC